MAMVKAAPLLFVFLFPIVMDAEVIYSYTENSAYTVDWSFEAPSLLPLSSWTFIPIPKFGGDLIVTQDSISGGRFPNVTFDGVMFSTYSDYGPGRSFIMWYCGASHCTTDFINTQFGDLGLTQEDPTEPFDHFGTYSLSGDGAQLTITDVPADAPEPASVGLFMIGLAVCVGIRRRRL
jgi:hypothetical protein